MKRKVAKIGPSTMMVSLPSYWVKKHGVTKGQEIDVSEKGGALVVSASDKIVSKNIDFHLEKKDQFLNRYVRSWYHQGVNDIVLRCDEGIDVDGLRKELDLYLGYEIVEQGKKYCVIRNVAETLDKEFETILRKLFLMNLSMGKDSLHAIKVDEYNSLEEVASIEKTNNKLTNFCYRNLNRDSERSESKKMHLYVILFCLENIADHFRDICIYTKKRTLQLDKKLYNFYELIVKHYEELYHLYYKFDKDSIVSLRDQRVSLFTIGYGLFGNVSSEQEYILHHLLSVLNQMKDVELVFDVQ